ncbi:MAG: TetR/AcrR family transcriptional regulator [Gammaproteobacteria bacterium]|jgi:AcrR family transcriptional regulator|nr:TetR/AcrR family transcriptional regulator [Gammaproteobacteria bacterium]
MKKFNPKKTQILDTAARLLAEKGHSLFSMRNVSRECKIHLKTLQYYFPTKRTLLNEVLDYVLQQYYSELNAKFSRASENMNADEMLTSFVEYTFTNNQSKFVNHFYPALWAMALHDKETAVAMDRTYTLHRQSIEKMVSAVNPKLTPRVVALRAAIITAATEAMMLLVGEGKPKHKELTGLKKELVKQCMLIAKSQ